MMPGYEEDEMGGRLYDLTARKNKGWHMERYKLGGSDTGNEVEPRKFGIGECQCVRCLE